ncbi:four-carbon acid sugar kinase family protein [Ornithinimicrobium sp. LYQ92]|uniref:four-carbon acid sugar kinase family protein n=1 Tax=Serinicoccus sp. LYQ92 TaxID=3378798 RepID=UPI0038521E49
MARVLVVADDLTGANACAAGFAREGLRAVTLGQHAQWGTIAEFHPRFDTIVVTTDSRHLPPDTVRERVRRAVRAGWPVELLSTRVDTTLRGNLGPATEAMLVQARELAEGPVVALCQVAHPAAERVTVDGHQLLRGELLEHTELAHDPRAPVDTSDVAQVLRRGSDLVVGSVPLRLVTGATEDLVAEIARLVRDGVDVVVADALTEEHLDRVAAAALQATGAGEGRSEGVSVRWISVDAGPGALALARALGLGSSAPTQPRLVVSGSATELTRRQLARLVAERPCRTVAPVLRPDSAVPDVDATVPRVVEAVQAAGPDEIVVLATVLDDTDLRTLQDGEEAELPAALGRCTRRVLQEVSVDGLFTTGGDVTAAVLRELDGQGIEVEGEVVPLAVAGEVVSGPWAGMPVVTKGGLIGDDRTTIACLDRLDVLARARARSVRSAASREPL